MYSGLGSRETRECLQLHEKALVSPLHCISVPCHLRMRQAKAQQDKPLAIYTKISAKEYPWTHSIHHSESHRFKNDYESIYGELDPDECFIYFT